MRTEKFSAAGEEFEFGFYSDGQAYAGVNVKVRGLCGADLPKGYQKKLATLAEEQEVSVQDLEFKFWDWVFCDEQESWWEWARDRASELGLGDVFALGRSGGYLVVKRFTESYIDEICNAVDLECAHCQQPYKEHPNGKCLFDHTMFKPADDGYLTDLRDLRAYLKEMEESVRGKWLEQAMVDGMKFHIDQEWENRRVTQPRRPRRAQQSGRADCSAAHPS